MTTIITMIIIIHILNHIIKVPILPTFGIFINTYLIFQLDNWALLRLFIWTFIGFCIYIFYGVKHSKLNSSNDNNTSRIISSSDE